MTNDLTVNCMLKNLKNQRILGSYNSNKLYRDIFIIIHNLLQQQTVFFISEMKHTSELFSANVIHFANFNSVFILEARHRSFKCSRLIIISYRLSDLGFLKDEWSLLRKYPINFASEVSYLPLNYQPQQCYLTAVQ